MAINTATLPHYQIPKPPYGQVRVGPCLVLPPPIGTEPCPFPLPRWIRAGLPSTLLHIAGWSCATATPGARFAAWIPIDWALPI